MIAFSEYYKYIKIKIDADLLDYVNVFTLQKNSDFENYKIYKPYEKRGALHELKYWGYEDLETEYKNYRNIDTLEKLTNIEKDIKNKIKHELDIILYDYGLLKYSFSYLIQGRNEKETSFGMDMFTFNKTVTLGCNSFRGDFLASCKFNTCGAYRYEGCKANGICDDVKYRVKYPIHVECN